MKKAKEQMLLAQEVAGSEGPENCLQFSERLSWRRGTELAMWPQGVTPGPTRRQDRRVPRRSSRRYRGRAVWAVVRLPAWVGDKQNRETPGGLSSPDRR